MEAQHAPTEAEIACLVDSFYARIRSDPVLGPVFHAAIGEADEKWDAHLEKLRRFWSAVMLRSGAYHGDPFTAHLRLPGLTPEMFERWLGLFEATCAEVLAPETAAAFGERAQRIARSLRMGLFERLPAIHAGGTG
jgi:hemoglobin